MTNVTLTTHEFKMDEIKDLSVHILNGHIYEKITTYKSKRLKILNKIIQNNSEDERWLLECENDHDLSLLLIDAISNDRISNIEDIHKMRNNFVLNKHKETF